MPVALWPSAYEKDRKTERLVGALPAKKLTVHLYTLHARTNCSLSPPFGLISTHTITPRTETSRRMEVCSGKNTAMWGAPLRAPADVGSQRPFSSSLRSRIPYQTNNHSVVCKHTGIGRSCSQKKRISNVLLGNRANAL